MALKFLNKKGWHTGSLRNIENVWKAEQKHGAEQKKLDELRKQIQEERERSEFRLLQEQAGLVPKQERLDFLYESGLAVGKGSSEGFKALETLPKTETDASSSAAQQASVPGALFEEKPQSANDTWRKLHSDPLLMIRQREQDALARIKNNPIQMARIRKSVEEKKKDKKKHERKENRKHHHKNPSREKNSSSKASFNSESITEEKQSYHSNSKHKEHSRKDRSDLEVSARKKEEGRKRSHPREDYSSKGQSDSEVASSEEEDKRHSSPHKSKRQKHSPDSQPGRRERERERENRSGTHRVSSSQNLDSERETAATRHKHHRQTASMKLSEEERSAKLREMEMDAKLHDEQRWNRIKKASEDDAREASRKGSSTGRNFLNVAQRSIYGAEKGGSSTVEESVRRRTHYLQGRSEAEGNAFRR